LTEFGTAYPRPRASRHINLLDRWTDPGVIWSPVSRPPLLPLPS